MITQTAYKYSHSIGIYAIAPGRGFNHPVDVALGRNGVLYVLDRGGSDTALRIPFKRVTICTVDEEYIRSIPLGAIGEGEAMWPVAVAIDRDENVYVSDEAFHRITIFSAEGRPLGQWGVKGKGDGQLDRPAGIAFDKDDNLLVVDSLNNRVQRFTKDGKFIGGWGNPGSGPGELNTPWGISLDESGNVYVADWGNDRIQKFNSAGNHLVSWGISGGGDGEFLRPSGVDVDTDGNIYVADWGNERVQVLGPDGRFLAKFRGESVLSSWAKDYFISNQDELEEREKANMEPELDLPATDFTRNESAHIEKLFWGPASVKVDSQGRVYVVESCRHRIQVYQKQDL